jgi:hypothetical protein
MNPGGHPGVHQATLVAYYDIEIVAPPGAPV